MSAVRVVAVTQSDPFFTGRFFETFLEAAAPAVELVEIVVLPNFNESRTALLRRLERFYGPRDLVRLFGRYLRARVDDRRGIARSVEAVAARHGIPARRRPTINDRRYIAALADRDIDVLLSVAAPEIFRADTLRAAPRVLNVHSGRLPEYRGMMPTFWALLDGAEQVVVTVHEMAERLDAGPVVAEFPVDIAEDDSAYDVARRAKAIAGQRIAGLLATVGTEAWPEARHIDAAAGTYRGFPQRDDTRRLRAAGRKLL
jgi:methionyl-tRNA formyltransferase